MRSVFFIIVIFALALANACSKRPAEPANGATAPTASPVASTAAAPAAAPAAAHTPSNRFTAADIANLKWLEGTWRGMDGDNPFFERYRFDGTTMTVENFEDEKLGKPTDTARFELKDGVFGHIEGDKSSAASEITKDRVQFVPVGGSGNTFRFERQPDGTWQAIIQWTEKDNAPHEKIYIMEPFKK